MKKKIVLFASAVLAAMAMTTASAFAKEAAGDVNSNGVVDTQDAVWILEQALSKDYAATNPDFVLELANVDEDKNVEPKNEITANDAALAFKLASEQTTLKLAVVTQKWGEVVLADLDREFDGFDTGIRELVDGKIAQIGEKLDNPDSSLNSDEGKDRIETLRKQFTKSVNKVKFNVGGKSVTLKDQVGWDILGYAANPLLVEPIYDDAAVKAALAGTAGYSVLEDLSKNNGRLQTEAAKAAAAKVDEVSLPNNADKLNASAKDAYAFGQQVYNVAFGEGGVLKTAPSADDVIESKNRVVDVIKDRKRFGGTLELKFADTVKKSFTLNKNVDESEELIKAFDGKDYNTITVHDVYEIYANLAGVTVDEADANGVYGKITAKTGSHDIDLVLVKNK